MNELKRGDFFGELALDHPESIRQASVVATSTVSVLAIDRTDVVRLIGDPKNISEKVEKERKKVEIKLTKRTSSNNKYKLSDFAQLSILGEGGFGKVHLVKHKNGNDYYARKQLSKKFANKTDIELETKIMQNEEMNNFIVKLWFTLTDTKYVYMYMEACLGIG